MARRLLVLVVVLVWLFGPGLMLVRAGETKPVKTPATEKVTPDKAAADKAAADKAEKSEPEDYYELQKLLVDTLDQVERNYVKGISRRELVEAAIQGVLSKLDPYSSYIEPKELEGFRTTVDSEFGGIGIQLDATDDGQLKILSPLVGTPAYRAGLQPGDRIVEINGKPTDGLSMDEAVGQLKGKEGTELSLTVVHSGKTARDKVTLRREVIHVDTVLGDHRGPDNAWVYMLDETQKIGYIRVTAFSRDTPRELREALETLTKQKMRALVLDLRFNPGGLLPAAIEVCDLFISEGRIVSTQGRNAKERVWNAHKEGTFEGFDMVVLVNRYSASASEIVAACLQDHHRAVIMGERTWGKGSVQNVIELENGSSALKLTTATYFRPSGKNIHRFPDAKEEDEWGVLPDAGYQQRLSPPEMVALQNERRARDVVAPKRDSAEKKVAEAAAQAGDKKVETTSARPETALTATAKDPHLRMALEYLNGELARAK